MDIKQLANQVFTKPIQVENSINIEFECIENTPTLFEALLELFTEGMKIKHGDGDKNKVDLLSLSQNDFLEMKNYFKSFKINLFYHVFHLQQLEKLTGNFYYIENRLKIDDICELFPEEPTSDLLVNYKNISSKNLKDYKFQLQVKDILYIIYFSI